MTNRSAVTSGLSDEELMRLVQADHALAFEELYDRHSARAFGLARVICASTERAEDAVQDAFLTAWSSRAQFDETRGSARTWLLALIRYRSIDIYRSHRKGDGLRASDALLELVPAPDRVEDHAVQRDEGARLRASLQQLPRLQREVIVLAYFGGMTHTEIGKQLDLPLGTVKGRMRLGLRRLGTEIESSSPKNAVCQTRPALTPTKQRQAPALAVIRQIRAHRSS